jgi:hypothetical protein
MSGNDNPGNFANRSKEEVSEIGRKGGQSSHSGGFASMDPQKQVRIRFEGTLTFSMRLLPREDKRVRLVGMRTILPVRRLEKLGRRVERLVGVLQTSR